MIILVDSFRMQSTVAGKACDILIVSPKVDTE